MSKIANHVAKKTPKTNGVFIFDNQIQIDSVLKKIDIGNVWGVGRKWSAQLQSHGVTSAYDLVHADEGMIRRKCSVVLQRTVQELNGNSCISIEDLPEKKQLLVSRSFRESCHFNFYTINKQVGDRVLYTNKRETPYPY